MDRREEKTVSNPEIQCNRYFCLKFFSHEKYVKLGASSLTRSDSPNRNSVSKMGYIFLKLEKFNLFLTIMKQK